MRKGTDLCKCLLWQSKMLCTHQIHLVFFLWNTSKIFYSSIPTVEFMWLMEYGWKWYISLPSMANTSLLHLDLHSPLQWSWRPHIKDNSIKNGRSLDFWMTAWRGLDSPHDPSCLLHWTGMRGAVCYNSWITLTNAPAMCWRWHYAHTLMPNKK